MRGSPDEPATPSLPFIHPTPPCCGTPPSSVEARRRVVHRVQPPPSTARAAAHPSPAPAVPRTASARSTASVGKRHMPATSPPIDRNLRAGHPASGPCWFSSGLHIPEHCDDIARQSHLVSLTHSTLAPMPAASHARARITPSRPASGHRQTRAHAWPRSPRHRMRGSSSTRACHIDCLSGIAPLSGGPGQCCLHTRGPGVPRVHGDGPDGADRYTTEVIVFPACAGMAPRRP